MISWIEECVPFAKEDFQRRKQMDNSTRNAIISYYNGLVDWVTNQSHSFANNVPPRPFPMPPDKGIETGEITGEYIVTPLVKFTTMGAGHLVILVPEVSEIARAKDAFVNSR